MTLLIVSGVVIGRWSVGVCGGEKREGREEVKTQHNSPYNFCVPLFVLKRRKKFNRNIDCFRDIGCDAEWGTLHITQNVLCAFLLSCVVNQKILHSLSQLVSMNVAGSNSQSKKDLQAK